ncbi:MAG: MerR family transcriptional regulator [Chloroflexi bacterium]|jgi:DNA-binding transcriptional MerR regulator|nr:MerR family transcriptional regulator [Chloroflexota bacterium]
MPIEVDDQIFYRPAEACQMAGISRSTLHRWTKEGTVPKSTHRDRNGWRLFTQKDIAVIQTEATRINQ